MNSFSDPLAINPTIEIHVQVGAIIDNGVPYCRVCINKDILYDSQLSRSQSIRHRVDLLDKILIEITMSGKSYSQEKETAVVLEKISIDQFDIIPTFTHLACYKNDHQNTDPTSYLGFNGDWILNIDQPFYQWKHHVTGQGWLLEPVRA